MILFLLKRDDTLKLVLVCALMAPLVAWPASNQIVGLGFLGWLAWMVVLAAARYRLDRRTNHFEVSLPISGRQLLLVRMAATFLAVWAPVAVACLAIVVRHGAGDPLILSLLRGVTVLLLAVWLPLSVRLREAAIPGSVSAALSAAVVVAGVGLWSLLPSAVYPVFFGGAAALVFARAYAQVPPAFQISPVQAKAERPAAGRTARHMPAWWPLLRSANPWLPLVFLTLGMVSAGSIWVVFNLLILVFQGGLFVRTSTRWLEIFPLSHRTRLALALATTVPPFLIGISIGTWLYNPVRLFQLRPLIGVGPRVGPEFRSGYHQFSTNVPLQFWRYARRGRTPVIQAPWGETVQPPRIAVLGLTFYNPYACASGNSERFREWQFGNATQAIDGRRIASEDYYPGWAHHMKSTYPGKNRLDILTAATLLFCLLAGVYLRELALWHALKRTTLFARHLSLGLLIPVFGCMAVDMAYMPLAGGPALAPLLSMLLMRVAEFLPQNPAGFIAFAVMPSLLLYPLLEWQFGQAEMTGPLVNTFRRAGPC